MTAAKPKAVVKLQHNARGASLVTSLDAMHEVDRLVGEALTQGRLAAGLERQELADRSNLNEAEIARYEHGRSRPSAETLLALSRALDMPIAEMFRAASS